MSNPNPMEAYLSTLSSQGGKRVAVLDFLGSLCPITLGHVQSVVEAHEILTGKATPLTDKAFQVFHGCVALISVNNDSHVSRKLASKGEAAMSRGDRLKLCELATAEYPWIHSDVDFHKWLQGLQRKFVHLDFVVWHLNGADDVSKYSKWNDARADSRYITMGRPGYTQEVLDGMRKSRASSEHFIVGREIPVNISSTEARAALTRRDMAKLATLLHPSVTDWCLTQGPWRDTNPNAVSAQHFFGVGNSREAKLPTVVVSRPDNINDTMLRKVASTKRDDTVWVPSRTLVKNGEVVSILEEAREGFTKIRTSGCVDGYIRSEYLHSAEPPVAKLPTELPTVVVSRPDNINDTMLRKVASTKRDDTVWVPSRTLVKNGEVVSILEEAREGFTKIRTSGCVDGYIRSEYLHSAEPPVAKPVLGGGDDLIIVRAWYGGPHNHRGQVHHGSSLEHGWLWQTGDRKGVDVTSILLSSVRNGELNFNPERRGCNDLFGFGHEWQCHKILVVQYKYGKSGQVQTWFSESVGGEPYHCFLPASPPPPPGLKLEGGSLTGEPAEKAAAEKAAAEEAARLLRELEQMSLLNFNTYKRPDAEVLPLITQATARAKDGVRCISHQRCCARRAGHRPLSRAAIRGTPPVCRPGRPHAPPRQAGRRTARGSAPLSSAAADF